MKFIAVILSVYVMALTAIPCPDVHANDTNIFSLELSEQSHNHASEVDLCSPFCICNCCQTFSQPTINNTLQINLVGFDFTISSLVQNEMQSAVSFWRPPKI